MAHENRHRVQLVQALVGIDKWSRTKSTFSAKTRTVTADEQDPLALLKEQLNQQEAKLDKISSMLGELLRERTDA